MKAIVVKDIIKTSSALSVSEGVKIYNEIKKCRKGNEKIKISFEGISAATTSFFAGLLRELSENGVQYEDFVLQKTKQSFMLTFKFKDVLSSFRGQIEDATNKEMIKMHLQNK